MTKQYYRYLVDLFAETLWSYKANADEITAKVEVKNMIVFNDIFSSGENATILISHIGNWELFCQWAALNIPRLNIVVLYTPIKNKSINQLLLDYRQRFGSLLISTKSTLDLFRIQKTKSVCINLFAIDQNPGDPYHQYWTNFFGQNVPVISGAEKFARSQKQKVYFLNVKKNSDKYELEVIPLKYDSAKDYDITEKQLDLLTANILENPTLWLLSHNRFKYAKETLT